jgi:hypothetical protein
MDLMVKMITVEPEDEEDEKAKYKYSYIISVLLVEETRVPRENHQPAASH